MAAQFDLNDVNVFAIAAVEGTITAAARHLEHPAVHGEPVPDKVGEAHWRAACAQRCAGFGAHRSRQGISSVLPAGFAHPDGRKGFSLDELGIRVLDNDIAQALVRFAFSVGALQCCSSGLLKNG
jgi:hypothetical protein